MIIPIIPSSLRLYRSLTTAKTISVIAFLLFVWTGAHVGARGEDLVSTVPSTDLTGRLCRCYRGKTGGMRDQEMIQLDQSSCRCPNHTTYDTVQGADPSISANKPLYILANCVSFTGVAGPLYGAFYCKV